MKFYTLLLSLICLSSCFNFKTEASFLKTFINNLLWPKSDKDRWFEAAKEGDTETIKKLLDKIDINAKDEIGFTALFHAVWGRHEELTRFLLTVPGIDVNTQNKSRSSALMSAAHGERLSLVQLLLQAPGININHQDNEGETALIWAIRGMHHTPIIKLLLDTPGINVNIQNDRGVTALMMAADQVQSAIVHLLLEMPEIDINIKDNLGQTAFAYCTDKKAESRSYYGEESYWWQKKQNKYIQKLIHKKLISQAFRAIETHNLELLKKITEQIGIDTITDDTSEEPDSKKPDSDTGKEKTKTDGSTLLDKAFSVNCPQIIMYLLQNAHDPQSLLSRIPFENISPSSKVFELMLDLAYGQLPTTGKNSSKKAGKVADPAGLHACQVCSTNTNKKCSRCKKIYYCCTACQKANWKSHKLTCGVMQGDS